MMLSSAWPNPPCWHWGKYIAKLGKPVEGNFEEYWRMIVFR